MESVQSSEAVREAEEVLRLRRRLLERIGRRFEVLTERHRVGWLDLSFTRVADPNRVLDEMAEAEDRRERRTGQRREGDDLHLPYWAELWDSALGMGEFLTGEAGGRMLRARVRPRVMDLGCGMGFAGCVAAALGARVVFADLEPASLLFARLNSLSWRGHTATRRLNWQTDTLEEQFDLITGADILYERQQWEHLEPFWRRHLAAGASVLLGEPGRQTGDLFVNWIGSCGWELRHHEQAVHTRSRPIRLFQITPRP